MNIGSIKETSPEKRISITPDTAKSFKNLGLNIFIEKGYAEHIGLDDNAYESLGAETISDKKKILTDSNFILQFNFT